MNVYKQERESDCMLACIACVVQQSIGELFTPPFRDMIELEKGTHGDDITKAFDMAGLRKGTDYFKVHVGSSTQFPQLVNNLLVGRRAILQVKSLNYQDAYHMVYWNGETLYDPSNKQVYQWIDQCLPVWVWLFDEMKS